MALFKASRWAEKVLGQEKATQRMAMPSLFLRHKQHCGRDFFHPLPAFLFRIYGGFYSCQSKIEMCRQFITVSIKTAARSGPYDPSYPYMNALHPWTWRSITIEVYETFSCSLTPISARINFPFRVSDMMQRARARCQTHRSGFTTSCERSQLVTDFNHKCRSPSSRFWGKYCNETGRKLHLTSWRPS